MPTSDVDALTAIADWPVGQPAVLVSVADGLAARIGHLGLRPGMTLTPTMRTPGRGVVVAAGDLRLALDRASATRVLVEAAPGVAGSVDVAP